MRRAGAWIVLCLALAVSSACASARAAKLREQRLASELDALRYPQPPAEVWQQVRRLLADRGCPLAGADAEAVGQPSGGLPGLLSPAKETSPYRQDVGLLQQLGATRGPRERADGSVSLDTGWRRREGDRYHADGLVEPDGFRVVLTRIEFDVSNYKETRTRDPELELELARRLAPQAAERIEAAIGGTHPR